MWNASQTDQNSAPLSTTDTKSFTATDTKTLQIPQCCMCKIIILTFYLLIKLIFFSHQILLIICPSKLIKIY